MNTTSEIENMKDSEVFPDKTIFYSSKKAEEVFNKIEGKEFTVSDLILILLHSHPEKSIFGRVLLVKQVFLLTREVLNAEKIQNAKFIPYRYGMYSFVVGNSLTNLEYSGYIERRGKKNTKLEQFCITDKGKKYISKIFESLPENLQKTIKEKRKGWDQLGYDGILRLVYQKYPEYKEKSRIKQRYKAIEWGRSIG